MASLQKLQKFTLPQVPTKMFIFFYRSNSRMQKHCFLKQPLKLLPLSLIVAFGCLSALKLVGACIKASVDSACDFNVNCLDTMTPDIVVFRSETSRFKEIPGHQSPLHLCHYSTTIEYLSAVCTIRHPSRIYRFWTRAENPYDSTPKETAYSRVQIAWKCTVHWSDIASLLVV